MTPDIFSKLWVGQGGICALCGKAMPASRWQTPHASVWKKIRPTFDHIRPRSKGGDDREGNLQLAHARCNKIKGNDFKGHG